MNILKRGGNNMKFKRLYYRRMFLLFFLILLTIIPNADCGHNWNLKQSPQETREAGFLVYSAISSVYESFALLERNEYHNANSLWGKNVNANIKNAIAIYDKISNSLSNQDVDLMKNVPPDLRQMIEKDLNKYDVSRPSSLRDLAMTAKDELAAMGDSFAAVSFSENVEENRRLIREINNSVTRFIDLGLSFSAISMWYK